MTVALNLGDLAAIDDYPSLFAKLKLWLDRTDLDVYIPTFISLAESYLNRTVRTPEMEAATALVLTSGTVSLPADCLQIRSVTAGGQTLRNYSPQQLIDAYGDAPGCPLAYAVSGRAITIAPQPIVAPPMTLAYWQRIPALTLNNPSNWLIVSNPDVYLFGALAHAGGYINDPDAVQQWTALFEASVDSLSVAANKLRYGGPIVARSGVKQVCGIRA